VSLLPAELREALTRSRVGDLGAVARQGVGERRSRDKGAGLEFADHRAYQPGDDLRHLDVSVYARHRVPVVKQYHPLRRLDVALLVDASASMAFGRPSKFGVALRLAAGLACAALAGSDRVRIDLLGAEGEPRRLQAAGLQRLEEVLHGLESASAGRRGDLQGAIAAVAPDLPEGAVTIVISDFLDEEVDEALSPLAERAGALLGMQLLAPEELRPDLPEGASRLVDAETGASLELSWSEETRLRYDRELAALQDEVRNALLRLEGHFVPLSTEVPLSELFLVDLPREGVLR
jgi:uncharacterized protein (DUF58 family)